MFNVNKKQKFCPVIKWDSHYSNNIWHSISLKYLMPNDTEYTKDLNKGAQKYCFLMTIIKLFVHYGHTITILTQKSFKN